MSDIHHKYKEHDLWKYLIPNTCTKEQNTRPNLDVWHTSIIWSALPLKITNTQYLYKGAKYQIVLRCLTYNNNMKWSWKYKIPNTCIKEQKTKPTLSDIWYITMIWSAWPLKYLIPNTCTWIFHNNTRFIELQKYVIPNSWVHKSNNIKKFFD